MTELQKIREKYPNSKVMFVFRHGDKTADGQHITPESIEDIVTKGPRSMSSRFPPFDPNNEEIRICLGSEEIRTQETAFAVAAWAIKAGAVLQGYCENSSTLGGPKIFKEFSEKLRAQMKSEGLTPVEALATLKENFFVNWTRDLAHWVIKTFSSMKSNELMLVPCHSPTVEVMYNTFQFQEDLKMKARTLEGIFLIEKENGEIIAVK